MLATAAGLDAGLVFVALLLAGLAVQKNRGWPLRSARELLRSRDVVRNIYAEYYISYSTGCGQCSNRISSVILRSMYDSMKSSSNTPPALRNARSLSR